MRTVDSLYRYPVKGLSPEPLASIALTAGRGVARDRELALTNGSWQYDAQTYEPRPKTDFLMLMQHERLATLHTRVDDARNLLTVVAPDGQRIEAQLDDEAALARLAAFVAVHVGTPLPGTPAFVKARAARFTDVSVVSPALMSSISLINLATVRDLAQTIGKPVNPLRFRANIYFDGGRPWEELDWVDRDIQVGPVRMRVALRTRRCAATNVDPETGARDLTIPLALAQNYRHGDLGVYAYVLDDGTIEPAAGVVEPE